MNGSRDHSSRLVGGAALLLAAVSLLAGQPARAQSSIPSVFVLDFNNKTTVGGALLGRMAAAQVSIQLSESQNWDVVPDAQVQRRIQDLGLRPPFDRVARVQVGSGVDAAAAVYGDVSDARVTDSKVAGQATTIAFVRIKVMVEDLSTGVLMNGAIAEGSSTPRVSFNGDADVLLEEALGKAAFKAREFMDRFRLPEGTVLNTTVVGTGQELDALINIGARQGVRRGMEMIVTRQKQLVGRCRVVAVDSDISSARVFANTQGVRPEDRVRAIFNFSDFPVTRTKVRSSRAVPAFPAGLPAPRPARLPFFGLLALAGGTALGLLYCRAASARPDGE